MVLKKVRWPWIQGLEFFNLRQTKISFFFVSPQTQLFIFETNKYKCLLNSGENIRERSQTEYEELV